METATLVSSTTSRRDVFNFSFFFFSWQEIVLRIFLVLWNVPCPIIFTLVPNTIWPPRSLAAKCDVTSTRRHLDHDMAVAK